MRRWLRRVAWLAAWLAALGGAWRAWHMPPVPRLVLEDSEGGVFSGHSGVSHDGRWIAAVAESRDDSVLRIWSAATGRLVHELEDARTLALGDSLEEARYRNWWQTVEQGQSPERSVRLWRIADETGRLQPLFGAEPIP